MIYDIEDEFDEKVLQFLQENGVNFEAIKSPFLMKVQTGLWQAIYDICGKFPKDVQEGVYTELYAKIPEFAEVIDYQDKVDLSIENDEAPLRIASKFEEAFFDEFIEKELEKLKSKSI